MIIGISGKRGSGKSTLAGILEQDYGIKPLSLAGKLKERVAVDFGLLPSELHGELKETPIAHYGGKSPRDIMIAYGQFFRSIDPDFWVKELHLVENEQVSEYGVSVSDVRFKNEADYIKRLGGVIVRVNRDPLLNIYGPTEINDISETDLDDYKFDIVLPAHGNVVMDDLRTFATEVMKTARDL